jgi:hypothetical protein
VIQKSDLQVRTDRGTELTCLKLKQKQSKNQCRIDQGPIRSPNPIFIDSWDYGRTTLRGTELIFLGLTTSGLTHKFFVDKVYYVSLSVDLVCLEVLFKHPKKPETSSFQIFSVSHGATSSDFV